MGRRVRARGRQCDWNQLVGDTWFRAATGGHLLMAFWVPSDLNPADAPTRPVKKAAELAKLEAEGFRQSEWSWLPGVPGCAA